MKSPLPFEILQIGFRSDVSFFCSSASAEDEGVPAEAPYLLPFRPESREALVMLPNHRTVRCVDDKIIRIKVKPA